MNVKDKISNKRQYPYPDDDKLVILTYIMKLICFLDVGEIYEIKKLI